MDKYSRYYGIGVFAIAIALSAVLGTQLIMPGVTNITKAINDVKAKKETLVQKQQAKQNVEKKKKQLQNSVINAQKKIYAPADFDLGNDSLFFTLYTDLIEMIKSNSIKVKSMEYSYNPEDDQFVTNGKDVYFVSEIDLELITNYVNFGKFIQDIYQYPYYIKILKLNVKPYPKDKKVLIANMGLRLYARTVPEENNDQE